LKTLSNSQKDLVSPNFVFLNSENNKVKVYQNPFGKDGNTYGVDKIYIDGSNDGI
jgi:hypothetical protein